MVSNVDNPIKHLIISMLKKQIFYTLNKSQKDLFVSVLWHILNIKVRINLLQLECIVLLAGSEIQFPDFSHKESTAVIPHKRELKIECYEKISSEIISLILI